MKFFKIKYLVILLLGSIYLLRDAVAFATDNQNQEPMEEVIVTAEFRHQTLMETAKSISVINQQTILGRGATHFEEILAVVPNMNYASGSSRARFFQIRGIGERSQFVEPVNPSVGILIDDVDFTGAGTIASLFDVKQVEVLKGPQGTRYGVNALAGLVNIKTNDPGENFESGVYLGSGHYGTRNLGLMLSGPISDVAGFRIAAQRHQSNGYINNAYLGRNDTNNRDENTVRAKLHWDVSDTYSIKLGIFLIDFDNGYDAFSLDNTRITLSDEPGHDRQESLGLSLKNNWEMPLYDLSFIIGTSDSDLEYGYDEDWTYVGIHPWGYASKDNYHRDRKTASYEWRLVSNSDSALFNDTTAWVMGFYGLESKEDLLRQYTYLADNYTSSYDFDTNAFYAQLDTKLSATWSITTGIRFESRTADYVTSDGLRLSSDETHSSGRISLQHNTDNLMTYITLARGNKAGGFNTDGTLDPALREFNPECLTEVEVGIKGYFLDGNLALRLALFHADRTDQQVKSSLVITRPDGSTEFVDFLDNAADGTNQGMEAEIQWYPANNLEISAALGYLKATFDSYVNEFGDDLSGRRQAHAPDYTYSIGLIYLWRKFSFRLSADGKDGFYLSDRHDVQTRPYTLMNANIQWDLENFTVSLWGRNLTDKDYVVRGFGSFGNDPRKFYITEPYYQFGEPRMVGLDLTWQIN